MQLQLADLVFQVFFVAAPDELQVGDAALALGQHDQAPDVLILWLGVKGKFGFQVQRRQGEQGLFGHRQQAFPHRIAPAAAAHELGMDTLVEVHDEHELERALALDASLLGINNRNLKTLEVDLATTERLAPLAADGPPIVCESGLHGPEDIARMRAQGVDRFLVGESLMRKADVAAATAALLAPVPGGSTGARAAEA